MKKQIIALLSLMLVAVIAFSACATQPNQAGTQQGQAGQQGEAGQQGGQQDQPGQANDANLRDDVTIAVISEWASLDPRTANDLLSFSILGQFFDTLVLPERDGTISPGLATHWEVSDCATEYTFFLREGVLFHNGDTLTADDVAFSINRATANLATSRITGTIDRAEVVDDMTVTVFLHHPYAPFILCAAQANLAIVSRRAVEEMGEDAFARHPVGTGPYVFVEWRPGDRLIMESFPDYWRGQAAITHATYRVITDAMTMTVALESGEIDMILSVSASERINIVGNPNLVYHTTESASKWYLAFNMQEGLFAENPDLRRAIAYAINREDIVMGALEGLGYILYSPLTPDVFGYPQNFVATHSNNLERARELVEEAGFAGHTIVMRTMESPNYAAPAMVMQEQLRLAGFDARVDLMERGAFLEDVFRGGQYELQFISTTALVADADFHLFTRMHSDHRGGGMNFTFTSIPEIDELLERSRLSADPAERIEIYYQLSDLIVNEYHILVPLYVTMNSAASVAGLGGLEAHSAQRYFIFDLYWTN